MEQAAFLADITTIMRIGNCLGDMAVERCRETDRGKPKFEKSVF